jgi:hypothetical protein
MRRYQLIVSVANWQWQCGVSDDIGLTWLSMAIWGNEKKTYRSLPDCLVHRERRIRIVNGWEAKSLDNQDNICLRQPIYKKVVFSCSSRNICCIYVQVCSIAGAMCCRNWVAPSATRWRSQLSCKGSFLYFLQRSDCVTTLPSSLWHRRLEQLRDHLCWMNLQTRTQSCPSGWWSLHLDTGWSWLE